MYLSVVICNETLYEEAKGFFLQQGKSDLMMKNQNSLIGAYLITKYLRENGKPNFTFIDGVYTYEDMFFSTSHSDDFLMIAIDDKKLAVDIEVIHNRDTSLLRNVKIPNSEYSKWENFYIQWCAKECLVKFLNLTSNEMNEMKVVKFEPHRHFSVNDWEFESVITLSFKGEEYRVHVDVKNGRVMALMKQRSTAENNKNNPSRSLPDNGQYMCSMEREGMFKPID